MKSINSLIGCLGYTPNHEPLHELMLELGIKKNPKVRTEATDVLEHKGLNLCFREREYFEAEHKIKAKSRGEAVLYAVALENNNWSATNGIHTGMGYDEVIVALGESLVFNRDFKKYSEVKLENIISNVNRKSVHFLNSLVHTIEYTDHTRQKIECIIISFSDDYSYIDYNIPWPCQK
jgi:hypothetical protein